MNTHSGSRKLRFAVMLQNNFLKQWQSDVIQKLIDHGVAEPVLLIFNSESSHEIQRSASSNPNILWRLYEKLYLRKGPLQNIPLPSFLAETATISCMTIKKGKFSQFFSYEDIGKILQFQPDFILRFGFSIIRGDILNIAPYGIWSFHHSDEQVIRGGPAGFWELFHKHHRQGVILQRLTEHLDGGIVMKKRFYKTILHNNALNIFQILQSSSDMPLQVCKDILNGEADYFGDKPVASNASIYTFPGLFVMLAFPFRQFIRRINHNFKDLFVHEKWSVGIAEQEFPNILQNKKITEETIIFGYDSSNKYPADPFLLETGSRFRLFFEHFDYRKGKGGISTILYNKENGFHEEKEITPNISHKSFPFVFQNEGKTYILPEQIETGKTDLYEWDEGNQQLIFIQTLLEHPLADPVLNYYNDIWWLFGSLPGPDVNNSLRLYYSKTLNGRYEAHPQNSIVFNPCGARMAGPLIHFEDKLYRPGQDSETYYGKRICIFEIQQITDTKYNEKFVTYIDPFHHKKLRKGIHTIQVSAPYVIFDGKKTVFSHQGFLLRLKQKINRRYHV